MIRKVAQGPGGGGGSGFSLAIKIMSTVMAAGGSGTS